MKTTIENQLAAIRESIDSETVSLGEIAELQDIAQDHPTMFAGDPILAQWAGISEQKWNQPIVNKEEEKIETLKCALKSTMEMLEEMLRTSASNDQEDAIDSVLTEGHTALMKADT